MSHALPYTQHDQKRSPPVPVCTSEVLKEWGIEDGDMPFLKYFYFYRRQLYTHSAAEDLKSPCSWKAIRKISVALGIRSWESSHHSSAENSETLG